MEDLLERQAIMAAGYDREQVASFQRGMDAMCLAHPNRWVVYTEDWNPDLREYVFVVHADFATAAEATVWANAQPQQGGMTVMSTRTPEPGVYRI